MQTETAVKPGLHPYGAWYTSPGGLLFERDDGDAELAQTRLAVLRENPEAEPRYSHRKVVITYAVIGLIHLPLAFVNLGVKFTVKDIDAPDWAGFGFVVAVVTLFLLLALKNALRPPQRTAYSMFKGYLAAAIGLARGRAYNMLLSHDRTERLRKPPPPIVDDGTDDEPLPFAEQNKFERYWLNAFGGAWHPWKSLSLHNLQTVELAPDLVLMQADVRIVLRSLVGQFLAMIPIIIGFVLSGIAFAVVYTIVMTADDIGGEAIYWLMPVAAPISLGLLVGIVMFLRALVPLGRKSFPVRKLIVRVNGQWRMFNGELQGANETDVSWVLEDSSPNS